MKRLLLVFILFLAAGVCVGQTQSQASPAEPQVPDAPQRHIIGLIPPYDVKNLSSDIRPLSSREKFHIFADNTFDRFTPISAALDAGINQATNTPSGYGQGGEGYAKRFGVAVGDIVATNFFKQYMFPSLFHEDPRYFRLGPPGICSGTDCAPPRSRFFYAISRVLVTRTDSGKSRFNTSEFFGNFAAAGLVNAYYPDHDRSATTTLERAGARIGLDAAVNVFKEFWPDIRGKMHHSK